MYKLLLCWRYLRTRYIALASIVSVTLGVATMIVVNAVMAGFTVEMQARIHGILSDITFESHSIEGFPNSDRVMERIRELVGDDLVGMTATVQVPAMLSFQLNGSWANRPVQVVGVDEATYKKVSDFSQYLQHPENRKNVSFDLRDGGYDTQDHQSADAPKRTQMEMAGWPLRRERSEMQSFWRTREEQQRRDAQAAAPVNATAEVPNPFGGHVPVPTGTPTDPTATDPTAIAQQQDELFDAGKEQYTGVVLGMGLASYRRTDGQDRFLVLPGDDIRLTLPTAGAIPKATGGFFTVVDLYESKMSEYDSSFVFVPLKYLQDMRGMFDRQTGERYVTSIQIKLKDDSRGNIVRDKLRAVFPEDQFGIYTWRDKQGPLLAAVQMETAILNVLLFMIIAVAGFGILAIFYMIVVEKTRDIGILKSLGASSRGILGIFLGYGLSLGIVGSGAGLVIGLLFVIRINSIAKLLGKVTGHEVFDPSIYYFYKIPTLIDPATVAWIMVGAILIAVMASIMPARRASRLHPVEALRYE
jgi:lipoprotein-releasing system permease protein